MLLTEYSQLAQPEISVRQPLRAQTDLRSNVITKKLGCMGACMRNQGLFLGEFKFEDFVQEISQSLFEKG